MVSLFLVPASFDSTGIVFCRNGLGPHVPSSRQESAPQHCHELAAVIDSSESEHLERQ
jgi:hypothetical protein